MLLFTSANFKQNRLVFNGGVHLHSHLASVDCIHCTRDKNLNSLLQSKELPSVTLPFHYKNLLGTFLSDFYSALIFLQVQVKKNTTLPADVGSTL